MIMRLFLADCLWGINAFPDEVLSGANRHATEADMTM